MTTQENEARDRLSNLFAAGFSVNDAPMKDWATILFALKRLAAIELDVASEAIGNHATSGAKLKGKPTCAIRDCNREELVHRKKGAMFRTKRNTLLTPTVTGWYCPRCGASYGDGFEQFKPAH